MSGGIREERSMLDANVVTWLGQGNMKRISVDAKRILGLSGVRPFVLHSLWHTFLTR